MAYFVTFRNNHSQPSWTQFESRETFQEFYQGKMTDGSMARDSYPIILYEGIDKAAAQEAWEEDFKEMRSDSARLLSHLEAELGIK